MPYGDEGLTLTISADGEPASSNRADEKPASSELLEGIDELADRMGGMDMALNLLAKQSGVHKFWVLSVICFSSDSKELARKWISTTRFQHASLRSE